MASTISASGSVAQVAKLVVAVPSEAREPPSITNAQFLAWHATVNYSTLSDKVEAELTDLWAREEAILWQQPYCQPGPELDPVALERTIISQPYNSHALQALFCLNWAIVLTSSKGDKAQWAARYRIRRWLGPLKELAAGSNGLVASDEKHPGMLVKAPAPGSTVIHDAFIGIMGTNQLRRDNLGFAYILGLFPCSTPIFTSDGQLLTYCSTKPSVAQVIYENVMPAVSLGKYIINGCTGPQFLAAYYMTICNLWHGHKVCQFTHYDLHADNVLVRQLSQAYLVPIPHPQGRLYIVSSVVPTMIDFGMSHVVVDGKHYGHFEYGSYRKDHSYPLHDAYKLLMFAAITADPSILDSKKVLINSQVFHVCQRLFSYFNRQDSFKLCLKEQRVRYYDLPPLDYLLALDLSGYIDYIETNLSEMFTLGRGDASAIYQCQPVLTGSLTAAETKTTVSAGQPCTSTSTVPKVSEPPNLYAVYLASKGVVTECTIAPDQLARLVNQHMQEFKAMTEQYRQLDIAADLLTRGPWNPMGSGDITDVNLDSFIRYSYSVVQRLDLIDRLRAHAVIGVSLLTPCTELLAQQAVRELQPAVTTSNYFPPQAIYGKRNVLTEANTIIHTLGRRHLVNMFNKPRLAELRRVIGPTLQALITTITT